MPASSRAIDLTIAAARAAADRKAEDLVALDVSGQLVLTDAFLIASGSNERQVRAVVDAVEEALHGLGRAPVRREGKAQGRWVLLDFGELVVHVQHAEDRGYYSLERLWKDCPVIELPADVLAGAEQV
ncbi:MAG: ribosome silencing factor [Actinobacteria bacterium]|nr:ribosome silencing factor [Actinomycetota bacterium]MCG2797312.1 ribosome silencing factor [Cellulomonas sp.]